MSTTTTPVLQRVSKYLPWAERTILIALILGVFLRQYQANATLQILAIVALATLYFLMAFLPTEIKNPNEERQGFGALLAFTICPKLINIGNAITLIGILFVLIGLQGAMNQLIIGLISSTVATLIIAIGIFTNGYGKELIPTVFRSVVLIAVGLFLIF
jgi:hypothetical protein